MRLLFRPLVMKMQPWLVLSRLMFRSIVLVGQSLEALVRAIVEGDRRRYRP